MFLPRGHAPALNLAVFAQHFVTFSCKQKNYIKCYHPFHVIFFFSIFFCTVYSVQCTQDNLTLECLFSSVQFSDFQCDTVSVS